MNNKQRRIALVIALIVIIGIIIYFNGQKASSNIDEEYEQDTLPVELKDGQYPKAPELRGIVEYHNTDGEEIRIEDYEGKVVLIDFWTYSCINCIRTLPYLTDWDEKYRDKGLVIIGVHTPEFEFEKVPENVQAAIDKYGIEYAVVQDDNYATWRAFENNYWPRKYLIDTEGFIRYDHIGEGAYAETEAVIQELLEERGQEIDTEIVDEGVELRLRTTPELYAGYSLALPRGQNVGNEEGMQPDEVVTYSLPESVVRDKIYLVGDWRSNPDDLEAVSEVGAVVLGFFAKEVNIVADVEASAGAQVNVLVDGAFLNEENAGDDVLFDGDRSYILVDNPDLYNVFRGDYVEGILELQVPQGFSFNAFTFG